LLGAAVGLPAIAALSACLPTDGNDVPAAGLRVLASPETSGLIRVARDLAAGAGYTLAVDFRAQPELLAALDDPDHPYDVVWPASSLALHLAAPGRPLGDPVTVGRSPVVWATKASVAERFGWAGRDVALADLLTVLSDDEEPWRFAMAHGVHVGPGAAALAGMLGAGAGGAVTQAALGGPHVEELLVPVLRRVRRSAPTARGLTNVVASRYDQYELMINGETEMVAANRALIQAGQEPLVPVYPADAQGVLDAPYVVIEGDDPQRRDRALALQGALAATTAAQAISDVGWYPIADVAVRRDPAIYDPAWGIVDGWQERVVGGPDRLTWREAATRYQSAWRRPSATVLAVDRSGSMADDGAEAILPALEALLYPLEAATAWQQPTPEDVVIVIPFAEEHGRALTVHGTDVGSFRWLFGEVESQRSGGGTNLHDVARRGLWALEEEGLGDRLASVLLLTDGQSNEGEIEQVERAWDDSPIGDVVAVHAVLAGDSTDEQVIAITGVAGGQVFDGTTGLVPALRSARAGN
jgi:Ca-activated chloride channel family protein